AEDVGIDLIRLAAWSVIEVPVVAPEETKEIGERTIRHVDIRVLLFDRVRKEKTAVEIPDVAKELLRGLGTLLGRLGETFEEQQLQEFAEESILAAALTLRELVVDVIE